MKDKSQMQIFLSYGREDATTVQELYQQLKADGYKPWMDTEDILPGQDQRGTISDAIAHSDLFIACLSKQVTSQDSYANEQLREALVQFARSQPGGVFIIPLKLDECEIPDLRIYELGMNLRDYNVLDYQQPDAYDRLLQTIEQKREAQTEKRTVAKVPHNLPRSGAKRFVGRNDALEILQEQLQQSERLAITAVSGMGGVGKTELALQYAHSDLEKGVYPGGICWLQAREVLGTQILSFAREQLDLKPPDDLELREKVAWCWRRWREGEVLIVFDDMVEYEAIKPYLPPAEARFKVLVTTRVATRFASFERLKLKVLSETAALALLVSLVGEDRIEAELEQAKELVADLGYLPLGLELVGRYLSRKPDLSLMKMRQRLGLEHRSLQEREGDMTAQRGVEKAFELSWQELDGNAKQLGMVLSLFAIAPIQWQWVERCFPDVEKEELEDWRDEALLGLSLLQREGEGSYQLHPLVQQFLRQKLEGEEEKEEWARSFVGVMVEEAKRVEDNPTVQLLETVAPAMPHVAEVATSWQEALSEEQLIVPFQRLGYFYEGQLDYLQAERWYEHCREVMKARLGRENPNYASSLNKLANLYRDQGRYSEAEPLYTEAIAIARRTLPPDHPSLATYLNNLAIFYRNQGRYSEAEPLYTEAIAIDRQSLPSDHPLLATSLNNLANLYKTQGRYSEAEPLYTEAIAIDRQSLPSDHPQLATHRNNLASLYRDQGRYSEAEPLYTEAIAIGRRTLSPDHPDLATRLNNLASLYRDQGRYSEAEPLYTEAIAIARRTLPPDHPNLATRLNNLALLYSDQGRYSEAEPLYTEAIAIHRQSLPPDHPSLAIDLNNLANLYRNQGRYSEAEPLYTEAIAIVQKSLPPEHPHVARFQKNYQTMQEMRNQTSEDA
jgi:tetratricopeptide (TPR) repeat protein